MAGAGTNVSEHWDITLRCRHLMETSSKYDVTSFRRIKYATSECYKFYCHHHHGIKFNEISTMLRFTILQVQRRRARLVCAAALLPLRGDHADWTQKNLPRMSTRNVGKIICQPYSNAHEIPTLYCTSNKNWCNFMQLELIHLVLFCQN